MSCESHSFNGDLITRDEIADLVKHAGINTIIETGTFLGHTTIELAQLVGNVHTIECVRDRYIAACVRLGLFRNIWCHYGTSEDIMDGLLPYLKNQTILVYLDAHADGEWANNPLRAELRVLAKHMTNQCVLVIDDFVVPNDTRYRHDGITHERIREELELLYPQGYQYYYIGNSRHVTNQPTGRFHVLPLHLQLPKERIQWIDGIPRSNLK